MSLFVGEMRVFREIHSKNRHLAYLQQIRRHIQASASRRVLLPRLPLTDLSISPVRMDTLHGSTTEFPLGLWEVSKYYMITLDVSLGSILM